MRAIVWLLAAAPIAFAQLDNDTIMVTVMREANVQPDQAVVAVSVMAPPSVALEDVLSLLAKADMTAEDLASTQESTTASTQWWSPNRLSFPS